MDRRKNIDNNENHFDNFIEDCDLQINENEKQLHHNYMFDKIDNCSKIKAKSDLEKNTKGLALAYLELRFIEQEEKNAEFVIGASKNIFGG